MRASQGQEPVYLVTSSVPTLTIVAPAPRAHVLLKDSLKDPETSGVGHEKSCPLSHTGKEMAFKRPWLCFANE